MRSGCYSQGVARPLDQDRRRQLLEGTVAYAAEHGLAELSLRPLALSLGTSDRMLLHYFASKEDLIGQALDAGRPDVSALLEDSGPAGLREAARRHWHDLIGGGPDEPRLRLLLEVLALAVAQPDRYGSHAMTSVRDWVRPLVDMLCRSGVSETEAQARATALVSGLRGLALDFYVTGDHDRTTAAAELLIAATTEPRWSQTPPCEYGTQPG
jgi:AcrR family transcriptional regulator